MSSADWRRVSPLSILFFVGAIAKTLAQNFVQIVVPAFVAIQALDLGRAYVYSLGIAAVALAMLVSVARYLNFRYRIEDDRILVREGIFLKKQLNIKFERVQGINTKQNIVYRLFGLVDVKLDTAGSVAEEGHLPAVGTTLAEDLREKVRRTPTRRAPGEERPDAEGEAGFDAAEAETLLRLDSGDLVRIGLSSNYALIVLALAGSAFGSLEGRLGEVVIPKLSPLGDTVASQGAAAIAAGALFLVLIVLAILLLASIAGAFFRFHRYELATDGDTLRSVSGLATRREHTMGIGKVQILTASQNAILRLFGDLRLNAKQAASAVLNLRKSFLVPIASPAFLPRLLPVIFGDEAREIDAAPDAAAFRAISRRYILARFLLLGLAPAAVLAMNLLIGGAPLSALLWPLAWASLALGIAWQRHRRWGVQIAGNAVAVRNGFIGADVAVFLLRKVQRVSITASPFQRRRGLANVTFYLAAQSVTVPYIDATLARQLLDYTLYKVESSELGWI